MTPPRLIRTLLALCVARADRAALLAELDEEFDRVAGRDRVGARRWYRRQVLRSLAPLLLERIRMQWKARRGLTLASRFWPDDVRQGLRSLRRRPRIAAVVVITLGTALGASFAVAAVVHAVLLEPLPFPDPDRIVSVWASGPRLPAEVRAVSFQDLEDWRDNGRSVEAISGFTPVSHTLTGRGEPRRVDGMRVARDFDRVLGVRAAAGRLFVDNDFAGPSPDAIVLAHAFWRREFAARADVIGQTVILDDRPRRIVGVLEDLALPYPTAAHDFWTPLVPRPGAPWEASRGTGWLNALGRIRPDAGLAEAQAELSAIARSLADRYPDSNRDRVAISLRLLKDDVVGQTRAALWLVAAAVGALLLVASANVVHLLVAHALVRQREFGMRYALGATTGRLARQIGVEAVVMGALSVGIGIGMAPLLIDVFTTLWTTALPRQREIAIVPAVVRFGPGLLALAVVVIGWPHARLAFRSVAPAAASTRVAGHRADRRVRAALIGTEVALSVVLVSAGALFVRTLVALESVDTGFSSDGVLTMLVTPSRGRAPSAAATMAFYRSALDDVRSISGVEAASASTAAPFVISGWNFSITVNDVSGERRQLVRVNVASPGYFDALRVPVLAGRPLTDDEHRGGADAIVVSQSIARLLFGESDAVGREFDYSGRRWRIVGVVPDLRQARLQEAQVPEIYLPWHNAGQRPQAILVRAARPTVPLRDQIVQRVRAIDPGATVAEIGVLEDRVARTLAPQRFRAMLVASLAALASLLAIFGVYSVTAFAVATQAREQAIRVALGETRARARWRVVLASFRPALAGAMLGLTAAWASGRFVESFLFDVRADDPRMLAAAPALMLALVVIAAWVPASKASRVDPAIVLREG